MKKITDFVKKHKLIIVLGFIASALIILKAFFLPKGGSLPQTTPLPTPLPTSTSKPFLPLASPSTLPVGRGDPELLRTLIKENEENFPLLKFVPYEEENFIIDYIEPLKLRVLFKTPQASQSAVFNWIRSKGVDPSTHQIEFASF